MIFDPLHNQIKCFIVNCSVYNDLSLKQGDNLHWSRFPNVEKLSFYVAMQVDLHLNDSDGFFIKKSKLLIITERFQDI